MVKKRPKREGIMLAYPVDNGRVHRLGENFFMQPKVNGERMKTEWFHGEPIFLSSYGNEFKFLDHIKWDIRELARKAKGEIPLDGEVYVHGWPRERIDSVLRRSVNRHPDVEQLQYHIFDIADTQSVQWQRVVALSIIYEQGYLGDSLRTVPYEMANQKSWKSQVMKYLDAGYEGGILRCPQAPWIDKRTVKMLKYKPTEIDEYQIMGIIEAISEAGNPKGMVGSFYVKGDDETTFRVGAGKLKHDKRKLYWQNRGDLLDRILIVKHEPIKTSGGIPICAVAVDIKEE